MLVDYVFKSRLRKCKFIALTPYSVDQFQKIGFKDFAIPENYYQWQEDEKYSLWFKSWLIELEQFIVSYHPFFEDIDIPLTIHCLTMLKNMMDSYIRTSLQYFKILEIVNPKNIDILTGESDKIKDVIDDELYFKHPSVYFRLIKHKKISVFYSNKIYRRGKDRRIADWIRCLEFISSWKNNKSLLFASAISDKIREAKLKGYKINLLPIPKFTIKSSFYTSIKSCFYTSIPIPLFFSIDKEFDLPIFLSQDILWPRINHFLTKIIPEIEFYVKWYEGYFQKKDFQCLVFNRRNHLYQYGALIAARKIGLKTIYARHGWDAYDDNGLWWRTEQRLRPFDYFICPNELDREFYKPLGDKYKCQII